MPLDSHSEQSQRVEAVRRWLEERDHWLLIFDNSESGEVVENYLPQHRAGQVLVTTRNH